MDIAAPDPPVLFRRARDLSATEQAQTASLWQVVFPPGADGGWVYADDDWHVLVPVGGVIRCRLGVVDRVVDVGGRSVRIGGVGGVGTLPDWRRRGLATLALARTTEWLRAELQVDFGLLVCSEERAPFYARGGWYRVASSVTCEQPVGQREFAAVTMVAPGVQADWPSGRIDLRGLPF